MKVAVFNIASTLTIGGSETYCWNFSDYLHRAGHEVVLFGGETTQPLIRFPSVPVYATRFIPRQRVIDLGSRFQRLVERMTFGFHCRRYMVSERFDVINIHKPYDIPFALWLRKQVGTRIVWRCHGTDFFAGLDRMVGRIDGIYCVSEYARRTLLNKYPGLNARVIYTGVDTRFFDPALATPRTGNEPVILYFGRLIGWKGVSYLVDALSTITATKWSAQLVGSGPDEEKLRQQIRDHAKLGERVKILPFELDRQALRQRIADADIVVFPSLEDETFSNAVLEAMSMGKAIVATRAGGNVEALQDSVTALMVPPRQSTALAEALQTFLKDPNKRTAFGMNARGHALEHFESERSLAKAEAFLQEVVVQGSAGGGKLSVVCDA